MARAVLKFVRMSPRKIRRVVDVIRGKSATGAQTMLKFMPYSGARIVEKVLKSAVSNAKENEKLAPEDLKINKAFVDQAVTLKRWRAMSRGRGYPILKRTSHITIEVISAPELITQREKKQEQERKGYVPRFALERKETEKQETGKKETEKKEAKKQPPKASLTSEAGGRSKEAEKKEVKKKEKAKQQVKKKKKGDDV